jgi:tetratricopeptide (TPR) repeat protein
MPAVSAGPEIAARKARIAERARSILREDYFQRLSLSRDASPDQVDAAFEALRTLWDPGLLPPALEDAKDDSSFVMSCLAEAHATLSDPRAREEYASTVLMQALRSVNDQHADDLAASGASDAWAGAQACFAKGDVERAERLARRAVKANAEAAAPLAMLAWLEALKPANLSPTDTRPRVAMLDRALRIDPSMEQAWYWRGMLHKRLENHQHAIRDFRRASELNPKNLDATRELRLYEMRIRRNSISMKAVK